MSLTTEAKEIVTVADVIREHWPTRDSWASARLLGQAVDCLRLNHGFTHQTAMRAFARALGVESIDPIEFDEVMFMADDDDSV